MVETARLNPLLVFGQGGEAEGSLPLEDCCQIGHQLQGVLLLEPGPKFPASPQVPEDWFINQPELGQGYVEEMSSEEVTEEGGVVHLPPLALGHIGAFVIERTRLPPLVSEGGSVPRVHLRGVHGHFLVGVSLCGGLLGHRRGGGRVSWGLCLSVTFRGCCSLSPPLGLGLRWRVRLGLGVSLRLGTPLSLRGLLDSRLAGAYLSGPLEPYLTMAPTLPLKGRAGRGPVEAVVSLV